GLCLVSDYEECKERYDSEVQFMEDEGYSYGIEDDDCVYLMKVSEAVLSEELDEKWDEENIEECSVNDVEIGDNQWGYKVKKYDI
ncbi:hypothetical protein, partial [Staphylococcus capitis]|uniref:hypothetical protein n=1 Tax=Staphylococcus capitis TaxID=29388 RepID=UPI00066CD4E3